jgi:hypothetical protein
MRTLMLVIFLFAFIADSRADCVCRCVDGEVQALCSSTVDLKPICASQVCSIVPSSIAPIQSPVVPPLGTSQCGQHQVLDPTTRRYEWQEVCR